MAASVSTGGVRALFAVDRGGTGVRVVLFWVVERVIVIILLCSV